MIAFFVGIWGWVKGHGAIALPVLAAAAGAFAAWHLKPQPTVHQEARAQVAEATKAQETTQREEGPTRETTRRYTAVVCPPAAADNGFHRPGGLEDRLVEETVLERGPVITSTQIAQEAHREEERSLTLTVTPQAAGPGWALQAGFEDVLHEKRLRLAFRRRVFGPFWGEVGVVPATKAVGAAVAVEW